MVTTSIQTICVYRDTLLPSSETFIRGQAESLNHFRPIYVCLRRISGLSLPDTRVHSLCRKGIIGRIQRERFKKLGPTASQQRRLRGLHPVLFHAHFAPDACDVLVLARNLDVPLVVSLHGYDLTYRDEHLPRRYLQRQDLLKKTAARFLCVSQFIRSQALSRGFPAEKIVVHYTGVDTEFFRPNADVPRGPVVLFVGRLVPMKGCEYLIRAMASVQRVMPAARLVIIGDGPLRGDLERQAAALLKNCEFMGLQPPAEVRNWMNRASVFSTPSIIAESGHAEGFGMVFAEAQSMGLPVVSSSIGGIPEVVADEKTGFLVPERDSEALATKLLLLLQNHDVWKEFSEAGRARVDHMFNIRRQTTVLENIYEHVLGEWASRSSANSL